jgi:hypothetical protein
VCSRQIMIANNNSDKSRRLSREKCRDIEATWAIADRRNHPPTDRPKIVDDRHDQHFGRSSAPPRVTRRVDARRYARCVLSSERSARRELFELFITSMLSPSEPTFCDPTHRQHYRRNQIHWWVSPTSNKERSQHHVCRPTHIPRDRI